MLWQTLRSASALIAAIVLFSFMTQAGFYQAEKTGFIDCCHASFPGDADSAKEKSSSDFHDCSCGDTATDRSTATCSSAFVFRQGKSLMVSDFSCLRGPVRAVDYPPQLA